MLIIFNKNVQTNIVFKDLESIKENNLFVITTYADDQFLIRV